MSNVLRWYYICENLYPRSRNSFFVINPNFGIYKMNVITNHIFQFIFWLVIRYLHDLIRIIFPIRNCKFTSWQTIFMENSSSSPRLFHFQNAYRERIAFNRPAKIDGPFIVKFFPWTTSENFLSEKFENAQKLSVKNKTTIGKCFESFLLPTTSDNSIFIVATFLRDDKKLEDHGHHRKIESFEQHSHDSLCTLTLLNALILFSKTNYCI